MLLFPINTGASLALELDLFPDSLIETKAWRGRKGNFFEEQNALEIILGISDAEYLSNNQATLTLVELATKFREQFEEMCNATRQ